MTTWVPVALAALVLVAVLVVWLLARRRRTLWSDPSRFTKADVGKQITVRGAGVDGESMHSTVAKVTKDGAAELG